MSIYKKLLAVQSKLKAPKNQRNGFGNYNYRSCEDILEAVKPILKENNCLILIEDEIKLIGERYYIEAKAKFICTGEGTEIINKAYAREPENKKGMDASQVTGASSSYARKYALNGLLAIDDTKDADTMDNTKEDKEDYNTYKMKGGKHKGKTLKELKDEGEQGYLNWLLSNDNTSGEMKKFIKDLLK